MNTEGVPSGQVTQLVMQLAGKQLLSKLLDDVIASMTPEQKAECATELKNTFLKRVKENDWDVRDLVKHALRQMVDDALAPLKPEIQEKAKALVARDTLERSEATEKMVQEALQRGINVAVEAFRHELVSLRSRS